MANFTRGPVEGVHWSGKIEIRSKEENGIVFVGKSIDGAVPTLITRANANLIASAFNSATKVEEMGFDGQKAIEELPNIVGALLECEVLLDNYPLIRRMVKDILTKVKEKDNG